MARQQVLLLAALCMGCLTLSAFAARAQSGGGNAAEIKAAATKRREEMYKNIRKPADKEALNSQGERAHVDDDDEPTQEEDRKFILQGASPDPDEKFCFSRKYRKRTMKVVKDAPFIGLFKDLKNLTYFEGSALTYAKGAYWAVFDSLRTIAKIDEHFAFRGEGNLLIPEEASETESQYEGLQYMAATDTFLAVRESIDHVTHGLVPLLEEIKVAKDLKSWKLTSLCPAHFFGLEDANKGWESIYYYEKDGERYLLGLCESNYCKTIEGDDPPGLRRGNGRLILTRYRKGGPKDVDPCYWELIKEIKVPESAYFMDYSGIAFIEPFSPRVAITSQEDAAAWVGEFDWERMEFVDTVGKIYHFPRDSDCNKLYCNVEGVTWLDNVRLMLASDRSKTTQDFACMGHDQSVHIMALP